MMAKVVKNEVLTEMQIKELIRKELSDCFRDILASQAKQGKAITQQGEDIKEIKEALLGGGNKYKKHEGLSSMIEFSYEFAKKNEGITPVLEHYRNWSIGEKGLTKWDTLEKIIEDYVFSNRLRVFFNIGSWAGIVAFILSIGSLIVMLKNLGVI